MTRRILGVLMLASALLTSAAWGQADSAVKQGGGPPVSLKQLIADLKAQSPYTRNGAAYQLSHMGPAAAPAVPALIEALGDPVPAVRYPVTVALREIGPAAKAAVPALKKVMQDDINDEVADGAKRAIRAIDPAALAQDQ